MCVCVGGRGRNSPQRSTCGKRESGDVRGAERGGEGGGAGGGGGGVGLGVKVVCGTWRRAMPLKPWRHRVCRRRESLSPRVAGSQPC